MKKLNIYHLVYINSCIALQNNEYNYIKCSLYIAQIVNKKINLNIQLLEYQKHILIIAIKNNKKKTLKILGPTAWCTKTFWLSSRRSHQLLNDLSSTKLLLFFIFQIF